MRQKREGDVGEQLDMFATRKPAVVTPPDGVLRSAVLSPCGVYRYDLQRRWDDGLCVVWVMLNPSTADANADDPTIRKVVGFTKRWGGGAIRVLNLYAFRATDPDDLVRAAKAGVDIVGPENDAHLRRVLDENVQVFAAWGGNAKDTARIAQVRTIAKSTATTLRCLGHTRGGQPRHPLMLAYTTPTEGV